MTQVAFANRPLVVEHDGERLTLEPGDRVPDFDGWPASAREAVIDTEKVSVLDDPELVVYAVQTVSEYRDELFAALKQAGYTVTKAGKTAKA